MESAAQVGGGTVPHLSIKSFSVKLILPGGDNKAAEKIFYGLLEGESPVLGILKKGELHFDVYTLFEEDIPLISKRIAGLL